MIGGQRTAAAALLVSVFVAGLLGGAAGVRLMDRRPWRDRVEHRMPPDRMGARPQSPGGMEGDRDRFGPSPMWLADRLASELSLSDEQKEGVADILEARRQRAAEAMEQMGPFLKAQLDSMNAEIRALLTPEQQERFDEFVAREDERMFRRGGMSRPGFPPGGAH